MSFQIRSGTAADIDEFVSIVFSACESNLMHSVIIPHSVPSSPDFWRAGFVEDFESSHHTNPNITAYFLVVEDVSVSPVLAVGFAKWSALTKDAKIPPPPPHGAYPAEQDIAVEFFGTMHRKHEEIMGGKEHWCLELIATRPGFCGQGVGSMLVRWGCERADADEVLAYLDASPAGRGLYEKFGFCEVNKVRFLEDRGDGYEQCCMVRGPTGEGGYSLMRRSEESAQRSSWAILQIFR
ncbi:acyl-CoA N-acyltransferase [Apodospora peruviana]|uniref:Acyl-CoA N-acyltransferase n=1 Tax=Apodospora peruviana TaxID=516989 RepID=A0AAE0IIW2_9PEZI|nr:acyl-CoA N-acyltransferase [Apodospora peruviana]